MKIATCQMPDVQDDSAEAIRCIRSLAEVAAAQGVQLLVFPEGYLQGYTSNDETKARRRALNLSSSDFLAILHQLVSCKPIIVLGLIETQDDTLYNTAVVIDQGKLIGSYRKTHPNERFFQAGTEYPVFRIGKTKFGINICNDANFREAAARLVNQGAEIIVYPLNNMLRAETAERWRDKHTENLIARAKETGAWVVSADVVGKREDRVAYGCSAIVNPNGRLEARVTESSPGMVVVDIQKET